MNIAVNTRLLLKHRMEGVARYIYETTKRIVLDHPEVKFHFLFDRPYDEDFVFSDNVIPHVLAPQARHPLLWHLWFERSVSNFLSKNKIDVFYSGDMYLSLRTKIPTLMVTHDLNYIHYPKGIRWSHLKFYERYMPRYHRKADHLVAVSEATRLDVQRQFLIPEEKISVAHNAVPEGFKKLTDKEKEEFKRLHTDGKDYFVYVGSVHPRKNIENLLRAFDHFKKTFNTDHKLMIYGRLAWKVKSVQRALSLMSHNQDVVFLADKEALVYNAMGAAEALCYVSLFEGFGIPILEAFSARVPVITSDVSSMPEVAGAGGLLVDPHNVDEISQAMHDVLDPQIKRDLLSNAELQIEKFSWQKSADHIFKKLALLASKPKSK